MTGQSLARLMAPVSRRVRGMIARCLLDAVDAQTLRQTLQVKLLEGELAAGVEYFEPYGFSAVPLDGDGLFLAIGGHRSHGAALAVGGKTHRPTDLAPGESCVYNDKGDRITIRRSGAIEVIARKEADITAPTANVQSTTVNVNASAAINMSAPRVQITAATTVCSGNLLVAGQISDYAGPMSGIRSVYNGHNHDGDSGGKTGAARQKMAT